MSNVRPAPILPRMHFLALYALLMCGLLLALSNRIQAAAVDPYAAWSHGHPQDSIPLLLAKAQSSNRWDDWMDLGLAAAASGDAGHATAWLLQAHALAPQQVGPRTALHVLGVDLPQSWSDRCWPVSWFGCAWPAVVCLGIAGLSLGFFSIARNRGRAGLVCGLIAVAVALPGQICQHLDERIHPMAIVHNTHLLDSAGNPGIALTAGMAVFREARAPWNGRLVVRTMDGQLGFLPLADCYDP